MASRLTKLEMKLYMRKRRARKKAEGLCTSCGARAVLPERALCNVCTQRNARHNRIMRARK